MHARGGAQLAQVPEQPEAGHVGDGVRIEIAQRSGGHAVERRHRRDRGGEDVGIDGILAQRIRDDARAERLGEHEEVADPGAGIAPDALGMDDPGDGQAIQRLCGRDRVPAEDRCARRIRDVGPAAQDLADLVGRQVIGKAADGKGEERLAAHREDVGDGVRGSDASVVVGIVDDRREDIHRLHDRLLVVQLHDGRIVERVVADQDAVADGRARHSLQQLGEARGGHLAGAASTGSPLRQPRQLDLHPTRSYVILCG